MEDLQNIAEAYYHAGSEKTKKLAREFFDSMDEDGNGQVEYSEFTQFLREEGFKDYARQDFFKKLDRDESYSLDFWEVMTLYYIIKSGRPFCGLCQEFITAVYFVCVNCIEKSSAPFYLCPRCYRGGEYKHSHGDNVRPQFLDTYTVLEANRVSSLGKGKDKNSSLRTAYRAFELGMGIGNLAVNVGIASCSIM